MSLMMHNLLLFGVYLVLEKQLSPSGLDGRNVKQQQWNVDLRYIQGPILVLLPPILLNILGLAFVSNDLFVIRRYGKLKSEMW